MKVKLKYKKLEDLPCKDRQEILKEYGGYDLHYLTEKEYLVYGIEFWNEVPMYYLCEEPDDNYITPTPADFFEIIDDRLSKYWKMLGFYKYKSKQGNKICSKFFFPEWRDIPHYQEKLIDGDPHAEAIFTKYKKLMDEEFD